MSQLPEFVKMVERPVYTYRYSVCTLVTHKEEYREMLDSFITAGFTESDCEFLVIDNSQANLMDAYEGINQFLQTAKGEYLIICHQDILLTATSTRQILEQRIKDITSLDPHWAILGNAGASARLYDRLAIHIQYQDGLIVKKGKLPQEVCSVDENFMLLSNSANLSLSGDLGGYHLYGLDLCHVAESLGYNAYVIDFLLIHKSRGNPDAKFDYAFTKVKRKYVAAAQGRYVNTTITKFYLSGSKFANWFYNTRLVRRIVKTAQQIKFKIAG